MIESAILGAEKCANTVLDDSAETSSELISSTAPQEGVEMSPNEALHYAAQLLIKRQFGDCQAVLDKILAVVPEDPQTQHVQAALYCETRQWEKAEEILSHLLNKHPQDAGVQNTWGRFCALQGKEKEAHLAWKAALQLAPQDPTPYLNMAEWARDHGRFDEAIELFEAALRLRPVFPQAALGLAQTRVFRDGWAAAIGDYQRAVAQEPENPNIHFQLSQALGAGGHPQAEIAELENIVKMWPNHWAAQLNLAAHAEVRADYDRAFFHLATAESLLARDPGADPISTRVLALRMRRATCQWSGMKEIESELISAVHEAQASSFPVPSISPFLTLYTAFTAQDQKAIAARVVRDITPHTSGPAWGPQARKPGRIRIGYLIADLRNHPNAHNTLRLYGLHDREQFEIFTYSWGNDDQGEINRIYRQKVIESSEHFIELKGYSDAEMSRKISEDGIQIVVDLMGLTGNHRMSVLARRVAPIQVTYLGYPGTTGADFIDYIIGDKIVAPIDLLNDFSETIVQLPNSYQINSHSMVTVDRKFSRSDLGLPEDGFVYACFNSSYKITPEIFALWMRVLQSVPKSVLWLLRSNPDVEKNLRAQAEGLGIDPDRLIFAPFFQREAHLSRLHEADLALDTTPYGAHTTASDALWAGVPLLTVPGATFPSRVTASILRSAGLDDAVLADWNELESKAIKLAGEEKKLLQEWRMHLSDRPERLPIFDTSALVRALETAYREMWRRFTVGEDVRSFAVSSNLQITTPS